MTEPITILYVDDYPLDRELVRDVLEKEDGGFQIIEATSRAELEARLVEGGYDLVLSDFNILGFEGLQVIDAVRTRNGPLPVVILTGTGSEEIAVEAMKRGAADYVVKSPPHIRRLPLTLRAVLERVRAEQALKEQHSTLRGIIDSTHALIFSVDRQYRYTSFNKGHAAAMKALYGAEIEIGHRVLDYMTVTADRETARRNLDRALAGEQSVEGAYSGEELRSRRYFQVAHSPIYSEEGLVIGVAVLAQDMTERKQSEKELQQSNDLLQAIIKAAPTAIIGLDLDGNVQMVWNPAAEKMLGWSAEEVMGRPLPSVPLETQEEFRRFREWIRSSKSMAGVEVRRQKRDGSPIDYSIYASPLHDAEGQITGNIAVLVDITERKRAEEARRDSEEKYRSLIQKVQAAIVLHDGQGRILASNPLAQRLLGLSEDQLLGRTLTEPEWHFRREDGSIMPVAEYPVSLVLASGQPLRDYVAGIYRLDQDETTWVLVNAEPEYDHAGEITQIIASFIDITARKRAEEALRDSERRLVEAQRIAHIGYWERDFEAGRITLSDEACRIFGLSPQGFPLNLEQWHQRWLKLIHPEDQSRTAQAAAEATQDGLPYNVEYRVVRPDGEVRFIHSEASVKRDESGRPRSMLGMMQDITERKQLEMQLLESNERFRLLSESSLTGIYLIQQDGLHYIFRYVNPAMARMFGYTVEELVDRGNPLNLVHPDDRHMVAENIHHRLEGKVAEIHYDFRGQCKDGSIVHIEVHGRRIEYSGKVGVLGTLVDITERKRIEEALRESEQRYRTLFNVMDEGVAINEMVYDEQGGVIDYIVLEVNPAFTRNSVYSAAEVVGKRATELYGMRPEFIREWWRKHSQLQQVIHTEMYYEPSHRWFHITTTPPVGNRFATFSTDVTNYKRAEEEIRQLNQELERRVLDRTAELEAANKELEAFAYSVSHDLRAPLRHIDGFLELLQQRMAGALDERSRYYMTTISDAAKRMGQLIDDLLAFSRMGRNEMSKRPVDLGRLAQEIIWEFGPETQDRSIHWQIAALPTVTGDWAMLRLVLVNLIANALKFTRDRPQAEIEIGSQVGEKEVIIFIRDNGVGFNMEYASKLFGVFQRLHRADEFEGTGIGLANVRRIINRHGGRVWAEGQVNQGATFYFSLPRDPQGGYYRTTQTNSSD